MLWILVASLVVLWIVVVALAALVIGLLRQMAVANERLGLRARPFDTTDWGLELAATAPGFVLEDVVSGRPFRFDPQSNESTLVMFVAPGCSGCAKVLEGMPNRFDRAEILLMTEASRSSAIEWARREGIRRLLLDEDGQTAVAYNASNVTPFVTIVVDGKVGARGSANHWDEVLAMLNHALGHPGADQTSGPQEIIVEERSIASS